MGSQGPFTFASWRYGVWFSSSTHLAGDLLSNYCVEVTSQLIIDWCPQNQESTGASLYELVSWVLQCQKSDPHKALFSKQENTKW